MKKAFFLLLAVLCLTLSVAAQADESALYANHTQVMGQYDTKADVRVLCYVGLVRDVCARALDVLLKSPELASMGAARDEIAPHLPFLLRVEVMDEAFGIHGDDVALAMTGRAEVNPAEIAASLARIRTDAAYGSEAAAQEARFARLESDIRERQAALAAGAAGIVIPRAGGAAAPAQQALPAPSAPAVASSPAPAGKPAGTAPPAAPELPAKVVFPVAEAPAALFSLRSGMSYKDMIQVVGAPAQRAGCAEKVFYNYGNVWVYFKDGKLVGYLGMDDWKGPCEKYVPFLGEIKYF